MIIRNDASTDADARWLGIDFSGSDAMWRATCRTSNVWITDVREEHGKLHLHALQRVQELAGTERPFERLATLLADGRYAAASIDAPFSVPSSYVRRVGGHQELLRTVAALPAGSRNFATGSAFVHAVSGQSPPLHPAKPLRECESVWARLRINVRSTMWVKPRGGAPMTAACLTLLHRASRALWPWGTASRGVIAEAFPAAQLQVWGLSHQRYNGAMHEAVTLRREILDAVGQKLQIDAAHERVMLASADALDAVLCAFGAVAVTRGCLAMPVSGDHDDEGWIAVHD